MKKVFIGVMLVLAGTTGFCKTWVITSVGNTFSPSTLTISVGDSVQFTLDPAHDCLEVSQATYNANGVTPLAGGFSTAFGGGLVLPDKLTVGTHYYVCTVHVSLGMKGTITVLTNSGIAVNTKQTGFSVYPNPAVNSITLTSANNLTGSQYYLADQTGRLVLTGKLNDNTSSIDISSLTPGVYLLEVLGETKLYSKVIKN
jgi:plastocyanin